MGDDASDQREELRQNNGVRNGKKGKWENVKSGENVSKICCEVSQRNGRNGESEDEVEEEDGRNAPRYE